VFSQATKTYCNEVVCEDTNNGGEEVVCEDTNNGGEEVVCEDKNNGGEEVVCEDKNNGGENIGVSVRPYPDLFCAQKQGKRLVKNALILNGIC
jgi:hypothetical protein